MSIAKELRKIADRLDQPGAAAARRRRITLNQYNIFEQIRAATKIATIFDVGANMGEMAQTLARSFPEAKIHAFEPLDVCQPYLAGLQRTLPQLTVHQVALGPKAGELEMFQNDYTPSSSMLPMLDRHRELWPKTARDRAVKVRIDTLDAVAERTGAGGPAILKLDVQGFELNVLAGAAKTLAACHLVQLEVLFESLYEGQAEFADLVRVLGGHGLHFADFVEERRMEPRNRLIYADAAFIRRATI